MTERVSRVPLTGGNIRNHHFYLRSCRDLIPADGVGGKNARDLGEAFTVKFDPGETVETDVDGSKMILRSRAPVRDFFERTGAAEGDIVVIERTGDRCLQVRLEASSQTELATGRTRSMYMEAISAGDLAQILKAASFAAAKHSTQRRKDADASPYINHPLALAHILCSEGGVTEPTVLVAALLHDTVEDTETTLEELQRHFGPAVASVVAEVTDDKSLPKEERKRLQVAKAAAKSQAAKLVKLADKISNLRDIAACPPAAWPMERRGAYFHWARDVVDGLRGVSSELEKAFDDAYESGLRSLHQVA